MDNVSATLANPTEQMAPLSLVPVGAGNVELGRSRDVFGRTVQVSRSLRPLAGSPVAGGYPNSNLSQRLQLAATLLSANLGVKVITIDWGSFDTHGNQLKSQDPQLSTLSRALAAFKADLTARGIEGRVMTVVFSEFGRRVESNNSGTDHGAGGLMLAMGSGVRGGLRGEHPGLTTLDRGDLRVTTDFRSVYSSIVSEWLGGDPARGHPRRPVLARGPAGRVMHGPPRARIALALVCLSTLGAATAVAAPRIHRTTLPPPATPPRLPNSLGVDEGEWLVVPSKKVVAAGQVTFHVNNRGMDDHDFSIVDGTGTLRQVYLAPGTNGTVTATLTPGRYKIYCSLFAGTSDSHETQGMVSFVDAQADPAPVVQQRSRRVAERRAARR